MKERPIIFSAPMVRAILEGRKTQTRRPLKAQPQRKAGPMSVDGWFGFEIDGKPVNCPYGIPGDRLWVRETFLPDPPIDGSEPWTNNEMSEVEWDGHGGPLKFVPKEFQSPEHCIYKTDEKWSPFNLRWRPSIHMPRWASRIALEVVNVRVERLQEISVSNILAEGVYAVRGWDTTDVILARWEELWDSIYADKGTGWETNPWVWVVEFKLVDFLTKIERLTATEAK